MNFVWIVASPGLLVCFHFPFCFYLRLPMTILPSSFFAFDFAQSSVIGSSFADGLATPTGVPPETPGHQRRCRFYNQSPDDEPVGSEHHPF